VGEGGGWAACTLNVQKRESLFLSYEIFKYEFMNVFHFTYQYTP
jgi:hypothetical protein